MGKEDQRKLNYPRTIFTGFVFMSICAFWQLYDSIIPKILKYSFGYGETFTGVIMALDNVLALFLLPFFGMLSDKTSTKIGKRTPFILGGTALSVILMMLLPYSDQQKNFLLFMIVLGLLLISMGTYRSPAVAAMPDLTPKPLRSKANAVINLLGAVGGVYTLIMIKLLVPEMTGDEQPDYTTLFLAVALFMVIAVAIFLLVIRENKFRKECEVQSEAIEKVIKHSLSEEDLRKAEEVEAVSTQEKMPKVVRKSLFFLLASIFLWFAAYNAVTTAFSRYAEEVWGLTGGGFANALLVAMVAAVISYIPIGIISSAIGRKKTILGGIILITLCYTAGAFFSSYGGWINVMFALTGFAWAAINVNSYPMVVEMSKGSNIGKYTGMYYSFSMAAQIMTPILSGFFLEHISYRTLFPYAVVFSFASFMTMIFVQHGDSKPPKKKSMLENFDNDD